MLTLTQAVSRSDIEGRIMKPGHPMQGGPFQFCGLYLVTDIWTKGFMSKRRAEIQATCIASGKEVTFSGIGPGFALTLFSNKKY